nr:hypothetical protein [uncultured Dyadobacter sp.]
MIDNCEIRHGNAKNGSERMAATLLSALVIVVGYVIVCYALTII